MQSNKFKNKKVEFNGIKFDSKLECNIYKEILSREIECEIHPRYLLQSKFRLNNKAFREIDYVGDFDLKIGDKIYTIDAKGMETPVFKIKAKMFAKKYEREIITIKSVKAFKQWLEINNVLQNKE